MTNAIKLLRKTADECESHARAVHDSKIKAELIDMTAKWHWLAGQAADLHDRNLALENA